MCCTCSNSSKRSKQQASPIWKPPCAVISIKPRRPGLVILISDLLSPNGYQSALKMLQQRGHEVAIVHVMSPDEIDPPLAGDLKLIDVETGTAQEVSLDSGLRDAYRERVTSVAHRSASLLPRAQRALSRRADRSTVG